MLRWTPSGAVSSPTTVQIRAQQAFVGRVPAGAPLPSRGLDPDELRDNIRYFTAGMRGPRTAPCTGLVLSGDGVASRADLPSAVALAREEGVQHVVLHAGLDDLRALPRVAGVDRLVVPVQPDADLSAAAAALDAAATLGQAVVTNTRLTAAALDHLEEAARLLARHRPAAVTLTYPFPTGPQVPPPPVARVRAALDTAVPLLRAAGLQIRVKGLPACHLGDAADLIGRTHNRWYVDAEHQRGDALVFFPDVVGFHKSDACRFCPADEACDGWFRAWLARPGAPPLRPVPWPTGG